MGISTWGGIEISVGSVIVSLISGSRSAALRAASLA